MTGYRTKNASHRSYEFSPDWLLTGRLTTSGKGRAGGARVNSSARPGGCCCCWIACVSPHPRRHTTTRRRRTPVPSLAVSRLACCSPEPRRTPLPPRRGFAPRRTPPPGRKVNSRSGKSVASRRKAHVSILDASRSPRATMMSHRAPAAVSTTSAPSSAGRTRAARVLPATLASRRPSFARSAARASPTAAFSPRRDRVALAVSAESNPSSPRRGARGGRGSSRGGRGASRKGDFGRGGAIQSELTSLTNHRDILTVVSEDGDEFDAITPPPPSTASPPTPDPNATAPRPSLTHVSPLSAPSSSDASAA